MTDKLFKLRKQHWSTGIRINGCKSHGRKFGPRGKGFLIIRILWFSRHLKNENTSTKQKTF